MFNVIDLRNGRRIILYNFSNMNFGELTNLHEALEQEINARKGQEFNRLVENVCEAIAELREAFPSARFEVNSVCDVCFETTDMNVFDSGTETITSDFFHMY